MKKIILSLVLVAFFVSAQAQDSMHIFSADSVEAVAHAFNISSNKKGDMKAARAHVMVRTVVRNNGDYMRKAWVMQKVIDEQGHFIGASDYAYVNVLPHDTVSVAMNMQILDLRLQEDGKPNRFLLQTFVAPKNMKKKERKTKEMTKTTLATMLAGSVVGGKFYEKEKQAYGVSYTPLSFQ